jgi:hypothetical protein
MPPETLPLEIVPPTPAPIRPDALHPLAELVLRLVLERRRQKQTETEAGQETQPPKTAAGRRKGRRASKT